jgi:hypothetical protein
MRYKIFGYTTSPNPFRKMLTPENDYVPIGSDTLAFQREDSVYSNSRQ